MTDTSHALKAARELLEREIEAEGIMEAHKIRREAVSPMGVLYGGGHTRRLEDAALRAILAARAEAFERAAGIDFTDEQLAPFVSRAGLTWCGRKDRETFIEDERYFASNWRALPGLRAVVVEEAQKWLAAIRKEITHAQ